MKLACTNTSRLELRWSADAPTLRSRHLLIGTVLVAADCAKVADEDIIDSRDGDRFTVSFSVDVPGGGATLPRKPGMAAWNPRSLADAGVEFLATETVTLSFALPGKATFANQMAAFTQIQAETAAAGFTIDAELIELVVTEGVTTMSVSLSDTVPGADLTRLLESKLRALPQSDIVTNPDVPITVATVAEAPCDPSPKAKRARTAPTATAASDDPAEPVESTTPEPAAVQPAAVVAPASAGEITAEVAPEPETATQPVKVESDASPAPASMAAPEPETAEPVINSEMVPPAAAAVAPAPLAVVPALPSPEGDFDAPEPPDFESYPPEEDAPEPQIPEAPDMPDFDVDALTEPPAETAPSRRRPSNASSSAAPDRPKAFSAAPAHTPSGNGKIVLNENDIF